MTMHSSPRETIRLYHFSAKPWALKTLWERRLKITRYDEFDDPFEAMPFDRSGRAASAFCDKFAERIAAARHGVVCFSATWQSAQMWAQYADRHTGLCLGFDVARDFARTIDYVERPLAVPADLRRQHRRLPIEVLEAALQHKPAHWRHQQEWRVRAPLDSLDDRIGYLPFDHDIELREVILGARCSLQPADIVHAAQSPPLDVEIFATRAAAGRFGIERHEIVATHNIPGFRAALVRAPAAYWDREEAGEGTG